MSAVLVKPLDGSAMSLRPVEQAWQRSWFRVVGAVGAALCLAGVLPGVSASAVAGASGPVPAFTGRSGAPPPSFWGDTKKIPAAHNVLELAIRNRTNGRFPNSKVYWSFNGQEKSIAQQRYIDMPVNSAGRSRPNASHNLRANGRASIRRLCIPTYGHHPRTGPGHLRMTAEMLRCVPEPGQRRQSPPRRQKLRLPGSRDRQA